MRHLKTLAVGVVLCAGSALAQDTETTTTTTTATDTAAPRWSLGAGVGFGQVIVVDDNGGPLSALGGLGLTPQASLEYRLQEQLALVLGASTNITTVSPEGGDGDTNFGVGVRLGLRRFLAGSGPTRLSLHGLVALGYSSRAGFGNAQTSLDFTQAGLIGGLAVDRELIEGLTLRLATDVAGVSFTSISADTGGSVDSFGVNLGLAPSLELRLAF